MSGNQDVALIVDQMASIENMLNQVIEKFCGPRREAFPFFWNVGLDSSIMPVGGKVKAAMAIAQELDVKLDGDALHKLVALRNAFAHHRTNSHPTMFVGKTTQDDESHYMLQIISNSGKISRKRRADALNEFNTAYARQAVTHRSPSFYSGEGTTAGQ
ncbi:MAG: hypothetical protein ACREBG_31080 [Pyrinomonadaceae bacterium]